MSTSRGRRSSTCWSSDTGSNAPERMLPVWTNLQVVAADGTLVPLSSLTPVDASGRRGTASADNRLPVKNDSRLVYDIAGQGFTRLRGGIDVDNDRAEIGSTLNPALRFFIFDTEPNMDRLLPPSPEPADAGCRAGHDRAALSSTGSSGRRSAVRRRPRNGRSPNRRSLIRHGRARPSAEAVADLCGPC